MAKKKKKVELTAMQQMYFDALLDADGDNIVTREVLLPMRPPEPPRDSNIVDVHMGQLRRKLTERGDEWDIETIRGVGYKLVKRI